MQNSDCFEGLLQIGSGAYGFSDIYSDIDFMAGCYGMDCLKNADSSLTTYLQTLGKCYIEKRAWSSSALGLSVYYDNGLSADISFVLTAELPIRSPAFKIIFSKTDSFTNIVKNACKKSETYFKRYGIDDSIHYKFINELRYTEIAILRNQFIFADISLYNARQILLAVETASEGKKLHQFKAYNTLSEAFIAKLTETYPKNLNCDEIKNAKEKMLSLYLETIKNIEYLNFDDSLLVLLNKFD